MEPSHSQFPVSHFMCDVLLQFSSISAPLFRCAFFPFANRLVVFLGLLYPL
jgi:hypothetical protein